MRRIVALVLGMLVLAAAPAFGEPTPPSKEEVVYARMGAGGAVDRIFVVNAFPDAPGRFADRGDYRQVVNLTTTDAITLTGDRVDISTTPGDFYYQGELAGRDMPWLLAFEYWLDDRLVSPDELQGGSGDLRIHVGVRKNPAVDPVFFENYMLQISINLDTEYFSEITADGATIAAAGGTRVVNLTSMPGKESVFVVTAVARDAHLGQIQAAGLPFVTFIELPNPAEYVSDLVQLQQAIAQLASGVSRFTEGVDQVADGAADLSRGASELADGAGDIASGFDLLAAGRGDFDAGLRAYNDGVAEFSAGMAGLGEGIGTFAGGIDQLADGGAQLSSGLGVYSAGVGQFSSGLAGTADGGVALTDGLAELSEGLRQLTEQGKYAEPSLVGGSAQILRALELLDAALSFPLTKEEVDLLVGLLQDCSDSFDAFARTVEAADLETFLALLRDSLTRFDTSVTRIEEIAADLQDATAVTDRLGIDVTDNPEAQALLDYMAGQGRQLAEASAELRRIKAALNGLDPLVDGLLAALERMEAEFDTVRGFITRLNGALQAVTVEDLAQLTDGLRVLGSSYRTFHEGLVAYVDGVEQAYVGVSGEPGLLDGARQLSDGLVTLAAAGQELADGAAELADGAGQLHSGLEALQEGAGEFASQAGLIVDGAGHLAEGGDALVSGHGQLLSGDDLFGAGLHEYASGVGTYSSGSAQFARGLDVLGSSGRVLSGGADTLRDETSDMDQQMSDRIDEAMADFLPGDYVLTSFTSPENTGIERVQFVYLTDAQSEEPPPADDAGPEPRKTLWERILDVFR